LLLVSGSICHTGPSNPYPAAETIIESPSKNNHKFDKEYKIGTSRPWVQGLFLMTP